MSELFDKQNECIKKLEKFPGFTQSLTSPQKVCDEKLIPPIK